MGQPAEFRSGRATVELWELDPAGDGVVAARLSTRDIQQCETARGQSCHG
jgi:hypothetical protein